MAIVDVVIHDRKETITINGVTTPLKGRFMVAEKLAAGLKKDIDKDIASKAKEFRNG